MLLSICVPTYNRGNKALKLVNELLEIQKKYTKLIEIVVSNNGSTLGTEQYKLISELAEKTENFVYYAFDENKQFVGNFNQVIRLSKGKWVLMLSDEDSICNESIEVYLRYIESNPQVGVIRANTSKTYIWKAEETYKKAGIDALEGYFLQGNYISGAIYNREFLTNDVINKLEEDYLTKDNNRGYFSYPHMFVETLLLISADFYRSSSLLIIEGEDSQDQIMNKKMGVPFYACFEERLAQAEGYFDFVSRIRCTDAEKFRMVIGIIDKTVFLVGMQKDTYISSGENWNSIINIVGEELKSLVLIMNIPGLSEYRKNFLDYIDALILYYQTENIY